MEQKAKESFLVNTAFVLVIIGIIYFVSKFLLAYLLPFVVGIAIAFIMQKPAKYVSSKTKLKTGTCAAILVGVTYVAVLTLGVLAVTRIAVSASGFVSDLPKYMVNISSYFSGVYASFSEKLNEMPDGAVETVRSMLGTAADSIASAVTALFSSTAARIAKSTPAFLISSIVTVVASCYIAKDFGGLLKFLRSMTSRKRYDVLLKIKCIFTQSVLKFATGYLLLMGITFAELFCGFLIIKIKYAFLSALLIAFIDILPVLGTGTVLLPWGLISIAMGNTHDGVGILILYLIITVVRNFLEPRIIGGQIGINPLLTLLTMFIGLKLFGFIGMMLTPVAFIVFIKFFKQEGEE